MKRQMCEERPGEVKPVPTELECVVERRGTSAAQREPRGVGLSVGESTPTKLPSFWRNAIIFPILEMQKESLGSLDSQIN